MSLHYIIDGYNLIKHRSFIPASNIHDPRFALILFLRQKKPCGSPKNKVTIIFDGYSGDFSLQELEYEVIFSCESSADERIKEIVESAAVARNLVIVSDDRQIRDFARLCGALLLGIEEFLGRGEKKKRVEDNGQSKPDLSYGDTQKINEELRNLWLKE